MQITNNPLIADMQGMIREAGGQSDMAVSAPKGDFGALLNNAISNVNGLQMTAGELATRLEMGDTTVSLSDAMIAKEKAGVAFEATVQVRNKFVDAYKEIMNMPV